MLKHLHIQNFALIGEAKLDFTKGFTVITGETGSGKSILLDSLLLLMGKRADYSTIGKSGNKAIVEAIFELPKKVFLPLFDKLELDYEETENTFRRELTSSGKSRLFVNDTPVLLTALQELSEYILDIHQQEDTTGFTSQTEKFYLLDTFGKISKETESFRKEFSEFKALQKQLKHLQELEVSIEEENDYKQFLFNELLEAKLEELTELEKLEQEAKELGGVEELAQLLGDSSNLLLNNEVNVLDQLSTIVQNTQRAEDISSRFSDLHHRISSTYHELKDIAAECNTEAESLEFNPERLGFVNARLNILNNLLVKHKVLNIKELLEVQNKLDDEFFDNSTRTQDITDLSEKVTELQQTLQQKALGIQDKRIAVKGELENQLKIHLAELGMPKATISIEISETESLNTFGKNAIEFMASTNPGASTAPIHKIASGGEKSRLMLTLKAILSKQSNIQTQIFDEIDSGVSGEIALKMGEMMLQISSYQQVLSVSHLPQVAAKATNHYKVLKLQNDTSTEVQIKLLSQEEREKEIAALMSGSTITEAALENARFLMKS